MHRVETIPLADSLTPELRAYARAIRDGFYESPMSEEGLKIWHELLLKDHTRLRVVRDTQRPFGKADEPVATFASWDGTLNPGRGLAPTNFITDVTVQASHRRRGLMKALMISDLLEAKARGDVFAVLTATDARLYGRFGFGVTATARRLDIESGPKFQIRTEAVGHSVFADPESISDLRRELFERFHASQFWSVGRAAHYWVASYDLSKQAPVSHRAAVHFDEDGEPDATVVFSVEDEHLNIVDLVGLTAGAEIELLRLLGHGERHEKIIWPMCHDARHPLTWALIDPRVVRTKHEYDTVWVRVLDAERAIELRAFDHDGAVTLQILDKQGFCDGTWQVDVVDGQATATPVTRDADVVIQADAFSSLLSGLQGAVELAVAGVASGSPEALERTSRLFATVRPPVAASIF
ncbi:MAG: GNAT family N-acetyltransferase [Ornithinimicrobium sp.]|uniref:GNAT family N-acetyltransferase n=1 Tax=Ornithinimicrobium sp. TaxID=1977084 RepID=UPI0026DF2946|nr:GNAT family N-acetyltransferase [Ornithinimicrobium sp.]MDO5741297.1 GNAT family N-acetyltransferase [Ornithinimicrobium sp.]